MRGSRKQLVSLVALIAALGIVWLQSVEFGSLHPEVARVPRSVAAETDAAAIDRAFAARQSDIVVRDSGRVVRVLSDDNDGSRHQRFVVELESGLTVLIAHNIDLAPRIDDLRVGDLLRFSGEYEWNDRGGVIHWTHHDPSGQRVGGWIEHADRVFE